MTRERDRIQENANKYKVLNCPAYNDMPNMYDEIYGYCDNEHDIDLNKCMCENITNCVIKQVIEKCREVYGNVDTSNDDKASLARELLLMFDIQEVEE